MSKRIKSGAKVDDNEGHSARQSMDRFGDDLCELVLSYLTIGDKIRFECLSRQWRRLVFNKQRFLRVTNVKTSDTISGLVGNNTKSRYQTIDLVAFEMILRKLKFLETLRIEGRITVDSQLIQLIAACCPQLQNLCITVRYIHDINNHCLQEFGLKCGHSLRSIKFDGLTDKQMKQLLRFTPNLRSITIDNIRTILSPTDARPEDMESASGSACHELSPVLPKLQELQFCRCNTRVLAELRDQYRKTLTKIKTHLLTIDLQSDDMNEALSGFARFEALLSLDLFIDVCDQSDVHSIDAGLRQLAAESRRLKHLYFTLDGNLLQSNLFQTFGRFQTLASLEIIITCDQELGDYSYNYGTIDAFRQLKQLKHLSLHLEQLSDDNMVNIEKHLPKLVSIRLNTAKAISDRTLKCLSKLKKLSKLEIICLTADDTANITDTGVCEVIDSCPRISTLNFDQKNPHFDFAITRQSVDKIVARAQQMIKIQYYFSFAINTKCNEKLYQSYYPSIQLPSNLSIEVL